MNPKVFAVLSFCDIIQHREFVKSSLKSKLGAVFMNKKVLLLCQGAMIAAIYTVMTLFINAFGLANGAIQIRISEALCILPIFTPAAIPGLFVGCLLSNVITGCAIYDIVFGSLATLVGAIGTYFLRKTKFLFTLPPVIANGVIRMANSLIIVRWRSTSKNVPSLANRPA